MNKNELLHLIQNPSETNQQHLEGLRQLVSEYPYFQAIRALTARITNENSDIESAAIRTADRVSLKLFLSSDYQADQRLPQFGEGSLQTEELNAFDALSEQPAPEEEIETVRPPLEPQSLFTETVEGTPPEIEKEETFFILEEEETVPSFEEPQETAHSEIPVAPIEEAQAEPFEAPPTFEEMPFSDPDEGLRDEVMANLEAFKKVRETKEWELLNSDEQTAAQPTSEEAVKPHPPTPKTDELEQSMLHYQRLNQQQEEIEPPIGKSFFDEEVPTVPSSESPSDKTDNYKVDFEEPDYKDQYDYGDINENQGVPQPIFKDREEVEKLQKLADSIQNFHKEEVDSEPDTQHQWEVNPDFFELNNWLEEDKKQAEALSDKPVKAVAEKQKSQETESAEKKQPAKETPPNIEPPAGSPLPKKPVFHYEARLSKEEQVTLIDKFISVETSLKNRPSKDASELLAPEEQEDLANLSKAYSFQPSEGLANIFLQQKKYGHAIEMYEQLSLTNPEKRSYFAGRIEELKKQQGHV